MIICCVLEVDTMARTMPVALQENIVTIAGYELKMRYSNIYFLRDGSIGLCTSGQKHACTSSAHKQPLEVTRLALTDAAMCRTYHIHSKYGDKVGSSFPEVSSQHQFSWTECPRCPHTCT